MQLHHRQHIFVPWNGLQHSDGNGCTNQGVDQDLKRRIYFGADAVSKPVVRRLEAARAVPVHRRIDVRVLVREIRVLARHELLEDGAQDANQHAEDRGGKEANDASRVHEAETMISAK